MVENDMKDMIDGPRHRSKLLNSKSYHQVLLSDISATNIFFLRQLRYLDIPLPRIIDILCVDTLLRVTSPRRWSLLDDHIFITAE